VNLVQDPSFEIPEPNPYWVMETDCVIQGASITTAKFYTGIRSLRINSRNTGPTCGRARQTLSGLIAGRSYRCSLWWNAQGFHTGKTANIALAGQQIGIITGITPVVNPWQLFVCPTLYIATGPIADLTINQIAGSGSVIFSRYFDDVIVDELQAPDDADLDSLAGRAAVSDPSSVVGAGAVENRVSASMSSLAVQVSLRSLAARALMKKP